MSRPSNRVRERVADVLVPVAVDQAYSYRVPADLDLAPGDLVEVPLGTRETIGAVWEIRQGASGSNLKAIAARYDLAPLNPSLHALIDWVARWTLSPRGMVLRMSIKAPFNADPERPRIGLRRAGPPPARMTPARARVLAALEGGLALSKSALADLAACSASVIDTLVDEGTLEAVALPPEPVAETCEPDFAETRFEPAQAEAAAALAAAVEAREFSVSLLEGVTGSGKTEVYFEALAAALRAGRQALVLMPEIALTAQFLDRFAARFGARPAEWHSSVSPRRRARIWSGVASGEVKIVVGDGGFVAKYMGDGVLAYFGYPQAHEHDAERAVQAGLAIVEAAPKLVTAAGSPLHVRVGIATGLVVVGDLIGSGEAQERGVVGETPNLAARLQAIAEPDTVVIAEGTRRLLGNLFELQDLGAKDLKGIAGPARAWAALRPSSAESRFEALHASGLTALVGREEEFELLLRRWSKAKSGEGQVVLLSGEAGIGKSRLTAALLERLAGEPHTRLRYFCSPQHTDSALYPIIGQMERAAGLAHDDAPQAKLDKLDAVLAPTSTSIEDAALFAEMLSLPNDGRYPALDLTPPQRRQRTLEALVSQMEALTRQSPVLMIFEDAHWTDPTSLEAFGRTVDRIAGLRVLLIVTFRPEFEAPWIGRPHVTALTLNRLAQREIDAMIDRVAGNKLLPASIRQDIVERTDGIPLFVEEMTKAVLEAEGEGEARRTAAAVPSPALAVPASLHASLMARLDRLGPAKEVAQIGAAIGREFSHALLAAVARKPEAELGSALDRLIAAGLLFRQGAPPHATYLFKHALVQDAAYGTLLREPRRALHARIAEALESQFAEIAENQPELLARHCTEAGLIEKAAGLWGKAGQRSLARSALVEAVAQLTRALAQIATLPATPALRREQIKLQVALITPLMHVKGYAAPETKAAAERARLLIEQAEALGEPLEDPLLLFSVLYGFWVANFVGVQRRRCARACGAVPGARREASGDSPAHDRASPHGYLLDVYGRHRGRPGALRSGDRALRSCRASSAGDAIWPRRRGGNLILSVVGSVVAWLSRGRARGRGPRAQGCARDRPSRHVDVCAGHTHL